MELDQSEFVFKDSEYCRKCTSCRTWVRCETLQELQQMFVSLDGQPLRSCKKCRENRAAKSQSRGSKRAGYDHDECYETHDEFIEALSSFLEQHDNHKFDAAAQSLKVKTTLTSTFVIGNDISVANCAQGGDLDLQKRAVMLLRNDMFDCTGYYFHLRRWNHRPDGPRFNLTCSLSIERKTERDL
ncbi:uncharacterized protein V1513DRAFT_447650 [Lipomyces chichibuensis]|uniref:uncharacterized protein n=1 Tax=Lipomyces chichibuensis TaxID=1546026 RepID=UPI003343B3DC